MLTVRIVGQNILIPNRWGAVTAEQSPEAQAEARLYKLIDGRLGFPAQAFKASIVQACRFFDKPSMVECKCCLFVEGEEDEHGVRLVPIDYALKEPWVTGLRTPQGGTIRHYRYCLTGWSARLCIHFMEPLTPAIITTLLDAAGRAGIGDWRPISPSPQRGPYGIFRICEPPGL